MQANGMSHNIGRFSNIGQIMKPVTWHKIAMKSIRYFTARFPSCFVLDNKPNIPGMKHIQLVSIAPWIASISGKMINIRIDNPITCRDSIRVQNRKLPVDGILYDLKKHILIDLIKAPISGTANTNTIAHIQAIRSSSGNEETNVLSRP